MEKLVFVVNTIYTLCKLILKRYDIDSVFGLDGYSQIQKYGQQYQNGHGASNT